MSAPPAKAGTTYPERKQPQLSVTSASARRTPQHWKARPRRTAAREGNTLLRAICQSGCRPACCGASFAVLPGEQMHNVSVDSRVREFMTVVPFEKHFRAIGMFHQCEPTKIGIHPMLSTPPLSDYKFFRQGYSRHTDILS